MALIGSIRKNGWILIVLMTLALGGFILMEIIQNAQRNSAGDINTLGKVNGAEVKRSEFEDYEKLIYSNAQTSPYQIRTQVWNYFVEQSLINQLAEAIGLNVGAEELNDLQFGNNLSPIIVERFKTPDGQANRQTLASIKQAIESGQFTDPTNRAYWAVQEKEIQKERLQNKVNALLVKGMFTPAWQAEMTFRESNERLDFLYARVPFDRVSDAEIQVTDADYRAYLDEFPKLYDQPEETRTIHYLSFDVLPTAEDSAAAYQNIITLADNFRTAENDSAFVMVNDGQISPGYTPKSKLPATVADSMMRVPVGTVIGPFIENSAWNLVKVLGRKSVPDSVQARHILIREATPASEARIDSLKALLESGKARFDSLAVANSADPGSAQKGGDLGYFPEGVMVPEFNEVCFVTGEMGKYYKVATQFGWHLIEITDKKFLSGDPAVKAAYISRPIEPSTATQRTVKDQVIELIETTNNLDELTQKSTEKGLSLQPAAGLKVNDFALGAFGMGDEAREVIRWAFDKKTRVGSISKEVFSFRDPNGGYFDSRYVVAGLKSISPAGKATIESLKANNRVVQEVKNRKKAEVITAKLKGATTLQAAVEAYGVTIDTSLNATLLQPALQNGGLEPKVVGTVFGATAGTVKGPIVGNTGVYLVQPASEKLLVQMPGDDTLFRRQALSTMVSGLRVGFLNSIKKSAEIKDLRSKFF